MEVIKWLISTLRRDSVTKRNTPESKTISRKKEGSYDSNIKQLSDCMDNDWGSENEIFLKKFVENCLEKRFDYPPFCNLAINCILNEISEDGGLWGAAIKYNVIKVCYDVMVRTKEFNIQQCSQEQYPITAKSVEEIKIKTNKVIETSDKHIDIHVDINR